MPREGRGDAGIVAESLWKDVEAHQSDRPQLKQVWISPPFSHCVFTASKDLNEQLAKRFTELMTKMDPSDPLTADVMRLEGTKKWLPGSSDGFKDLVDALRKQWCPPDEKSCAYLCRLPVSEKTTGFETLRGTRVAGFASNQVDAHP